MFANFSLYIAIDRSGRPNGSSRLSKDPLLSMFTVRLAARSLGVNLVWFNRVVCIELNDWTLKFDVHEYVVRLLNKNAAFDRLDSLMSRIDQLQDRLSGDVRKCIHSQDLTLLVAFLLRHKGVTSVAIDARTVTRAMASCLSLSDLQEEALFQLVEKFATG